MKKSQPSIITTNSKPRTGKYGITMTMTSPFKKNILHSISNFALQSADSRSIVCSILYFGKCAGMLTQLFQLLWLIPKLILNNVAKHFSKEIDKNAVSCKCLVNCFRDQIYQTAIKYSLCLSCYVIHHRSHCTSLKMQPR